MDIEMVRLRWDRNLGLFQSVRPSMTRLPRRRIQDVLMPEMSRDDTSHVFLWQWLPCMAVNSCLRFKLPRRYGGNCWQRLQLDLILTDCAFWSDQSSNEILNSRQHNILGYFGDGLTLPCKLWWTWRPPWWEQCWVRKKQQWLTLACFRSCVQSTSCSISCKHWNARCFQTHRFEISGCCVRSCCQLPRMRMQMKILLYKLPSSRLSICHLLLLFS